MFKKIIRLVTIGAVIAIVAMMAMACSKPLFSSLKKTPKEEFETSLQQAKENGTLFAMCDQFEEVLKENDVKYNDFYVISNNQEKHLIILTETSVEDYQIIVHSPLGAEIEGDYVRVKEEWMGERGLYSWYQGRLKEVLENGDDADKSAISYYAPGGGERTIPWIMFLSFAEVDINISARQLIFS